MEPQPTRMIDADHIKESAQRIADIALSIIDACEKGEPLDPLTRAMCMHGGLANHATDLCIEIVKFEIQS